LNLSLNAVFSETETLVLSAGQAQGQLTLRPASAAFGAGD
jgi:hypothetical protein